MRSLWIRGFTLLGSGLAVAATAPGALGQLRDLQARCLRGPGTQPGPLLAQATALLLMLTGLWALGALLGGLLGHGLRRLFGGGEAG